MSQQLPHFKTLKEFFYEFMMPLQNQYRKIDVRGLKVDFEQRAKLTSKYTQLLEEKHEALNLLAGRKINYNSNAGKAGQVPKLIYGDLQCPVRGGVDDITLTALKNNVLSKHSKWNKAIEVIDLTLDCRKIHKLINTYLKARPDLDGRMRTNHRLLLETGRSSTSVLKPPIRYCPIKRKNGKPETYGISFQTLTKHAEFGQDLQTMFLVDDGKIAVEIDGSQAEARVVFLLAKDYETLERLDDPLYDIHSLTSSWIYPRIYEPYIDHQKKGYLKDLKIVKKLLNSDGIPYRQYGKKGRHGAHYDEGAGTLALQMNVGISKAKMALHVIHQNAPNIKQVFHKEIQDQLGIDRTLWTPIGRRREFFEKWGDKLFKEGYAHIPQSTITDLTKWAILQCIREGIIDILRESHDSFTYQIEPEKLEWSIGVAKSYMEAKIDFSTCSLPRESLIIPSEVKLYRKNLFEGEDYHD